MPIKNYTTKVPASNTVGEIQAILAKHGACRAMMEYGVGGRVLGVSFAISGKDGFLSFRLPARAEAVQSVMRDQGVKCDIAKAENIAWRNVKDWIEAQFAMVETGQADTAEVFLPYLLDGGRTLYEVMGERLLGAGGEHGIGEQPSTHAS